MKRTKIIVALITFILLIGTMLFSTAYADASLEKCKESVVRIVGVYDGYLFSSGSGFAIGEAGEPIEHIVTNQHVLFADYDRGIYYDKVYLYRGEDDLIELSVVFELGLNDIAVLELSEPIHNIDPLVLNTGEKAKVGDQIYCLGFPDVADVLNDIPSSKPKDVMVTAGIVSKVSSLNSIEYYQIDAVLNPGNSGGPLIDTNGYVIGINQLGFPGFDINGALMLDELTDALDSRGIKYEHTGPTPTTKPTSEATPTPTANSTSEPTPVPTEKPSPEDTQAVNPMPDPPVKDNTLMIVIIAAIAVVVLGVIILIIVISKNKASGTLVRTQMHGSAVGTSSSRKAVLIGVNGHFAGKNKQVQGKIYIGRSSKCNVKYPSDYKGISNMHCSLSSDGISFKLIDIGSSFGTFLESGEKLEHNVPYTLKSGDKFYLADRKELYQVAISD